MIKNWKSESLPGLCGMSGEQIKVLQRMMALNLNISESSVLDKDHMVSQLHGDSTSLTGIKGK